MKHSRREFLRLVAGAASLPILSRPVLAQAYPARPVALIEGTELPYPGIGAASELCKALSRRFGQEFSLYDTQSDRDSAATERVARARPDGSTLLLLSEANPILAGINKINVDLLRDLVPVAGIIRIPLVMLVSPSFPANSIAEFIAYAKANPGKMNYGSSDNMLLDLAAELFKMRTKIDMLRIPHANMIELRNGLVPVWFEYLPRALTLIEVGWARALAVTAPTRVAALPQVPAVAETIAGYQASAWQGLVAPKNTPIAIVEALNTAINALVPDLKSRAPSGAAPPYAQPVPLSQMALSTSPTDFGKLVADDIETWGNLIKAAGIKGGLKGGLNRLEIP